MNIEQFIGPALLIMAIIAIAYLPARIARAYQRRLDQKADHLNFQQSAYKDKSGMICSSFEEPKKGQVQFFGTILKDDIKPGMTLTLRGNSPWSVKAIYLDRHNPGVTNVIAKAHTKDAALLLETNAMFDKKLIKNEIATKGLIFLELQ